MILVDTNVFLELFLGQKKSDECQRLLDAISKGEREAVVTHFTVHAVGASLPKSEAQIKFLRNLEQSLALYVYDTDLSDEMAAALLSEKIERDFDDSLQYYVAKKLGAEAIISFDEHLDGLDVRRLEPDAVPAAIG